MARWGVSERGDGAATEALAHRVDHVLTTRTAVELRLGLPWWCSRARDDLVLR